MGCVVARSACDASTGVSACAAQVEPVYRRAILRPSRNRAHEEKLIERQVTVKNISFGQPVRTLEIERGQNLPGEDRSREVRCVLANLSNDMVAEQLAIFVPRSALQFIRHVLNERRHDVLYGGCQR